MTGWGLEALGWGSLGWTDCFSISHLTEAPALFQFNLLFALARTKHISISQASAGDSGCCFKGEERIIRGKNNFYSFFLTYPLSVSVGKKCVPVSRRSI